MTSIKKTNKKKCIRCPPCQETKNQNCHYKDDKDIDEIRVMRNLYREKERDWKAIERKKNEDEYTEEDIKKLLEAIEIRKKFNETYIKKECLTCDYGYKDHLDAVRWLENKLRSIRTKPTLANFLFTGIEKSRIKKEQKQRKETRKKNSASKKIQKIIRGTQTRKRFTTTKRRNSATKKIQRIIRGTQTRKRLTTKKIRNSATRKIQKIIRGTQTRKRLTTKRRNSATIKIQASMRRTLAKIETKRIKLLRTSELIIKKALKSNLGTLKTNLTKRRIEKNDKMLEDNLIKFEKLKKKLDMRLYEIKKLVNIFKSRTSEKDKRKLNRILGYYKSIFLSNNNLDIVIGEIKNYRKNNIPVSIDELILDLKPILRDTTKIVNNYDDYIKEEADKQKRNEEIYKRNMKLLEQTARATIKEFKTSGVFSSKSTPKPKCICKNKKKCRCGFKKKKKMKSRQ